jgi:hypothetical protein
MKIYATVGFVALEGIKTKFYLEYNCIITIFSLLFYERNSVQHTHISKCCRNKWPLQFGKY